MPKIKCEYCVYELKPAPNPENDKNIVEAWMKMLQHEKETHLTETQQKDIKAKHDEFCKNKCPYRDTAHYECAIYGDNR